MTFPLVLWLFLLPSSTLAQETLYVNLDHVIQDNFLGVNAVYHGFTYLPESINKGMNEEFRAIEMQRVEQSGLHIARTFFRPDWAMGTDTWTKPDWNSVKMQALYSWLADMKKRDVDVALNMGWWFARDVIWKHDQHLPSYPDDLNSYTHWLSDALGEIIEKRGFTNVKYIIMFTEPGNNFGDIPHRKKSWDYYKEVLRATQAQLIKDGRRQLVKIVGPNTTQGPRWLAQSAKELNDVIDIYSSHNYNFTTYDEWYDLATKIKQATISTGKPFWIDEYGVQDFALRKSFEYGLVLSLANAAFLNAGVQTSLLWIFNDQYYPYPIKDLTNGDAFVKGLHQWGLFPWLPTSNGETRPAWQSFSLMSRLLGGPGTKVFEATGAAHTHIAAVITEHGDLTVMVVTDGDASRQSIQVRFSKNVSRKMFRYSYAHENIVPGENMMPSMTPDLTYPHVGYFLNDSLTSPGVFFYTSIVPESMVGQAINAINDR